MFRDGPEYEVRKSRPFAPPTVTLKQIHAAVPKHLLVRSPWRSTGYIARDVLMCATLFALATFINPWASGGFGGLLHVKWQITLAKSLLWISYWWFQGLVWGGIFCLGHDAGHGTLFNSSKANNTVGFVLHTFLLIPYFAWRSTHHAHHKATASIERDENYVPHTREDFHLPQESKATKANYAEVFEETPFMTLARMLVMQGMGWWLYLTFNTLGSKMYPPGTNHWNPNSALFKKEQRRSIIVSNIALIFMASILIYLGSSIFFSYYFIPYVLANHWIVMFTYLHHSDPTIPHYRKQEWSFLRGAAATVDRPLMGWMGRFFLHNISHDHVAHHFFIGAPFYNGPQITQAIRGVLKEDYNYDSTNTFYALWRSFTQCLFIENEGDIVFYKNKYGEAAREVKKEAVEEIRKDGWDQKEQDKLND